MTLKNINVPSWDVVFVPSHILNRLHLIMETQIMGGGVLSKEQMVVYFSLTFLASSDVGLYTFGDITRDARRN